MSKNVLLFILLSTSAMAQATCRVGEITRLSHALSIVPCGHVDSVRHTCTDTRETSLRAGTPVHITRILGKQAEIFVMSVKSGQNRRMINQFALIDTATQLTCSYQ